ncbi:hypothetical protein HFP15_32370 [Amycolatopsis sp. K13G38]|uniref:Ribosomal RNA adenine methylase transferase N-terminal domain-containing protein n=2 Tax=Amycolatopsis acididurans TaxID=2724524 RepID=A0ABX1JCR0_9PSEU|nr:hypothetical protein [Amycolatopsis acididurans]
MERDAQFVKALRQRFGDRIRVSEADIGDFPLPRGKFTVVASIPYALPTELFRRSLSPQRTRLRTASIIVEWGFAKRLTAARAGDLEQARWAARFGIRLVSRVAAWIDSAHVTVRRNHTMGERALWTLLETVYRSPSRPAKSVLAPAGGKPDRDREGCAEISQLFLLSRFLGCSTGSSQHAARSSLA